MSNKDFVKQHIVPQSYLNRFAIKGDTQYRIGVVPKKGKPFPSSVNNVGFIRNYYDDEYLEDIKYWEHFYSQNIEAPCKKPIDDMIERISKPSPILFTLNEDERTYLSIFIISQMLRSPTYIDYWKNVKSQEIFRNTKNNILDRFSAVLSEDKVRVIENFKIPTDQVKHMILSNSNDPNKLIKYAMIIMSKIWCVLYNRNYKELPFITSDNPVILINFKDGIISNIRNGIGRNDTDIVFPINPRIAIMICPKGDKVIDQIDSKLIVLDETMKDMVNFINKAEYDNCANQAFLPLEYYKQKYNNDM